jgi:serine/threonine-protein phosphatase 2B regulatory subunit
VRAIRVFDKYYQIIYDYGETVDFRVEEFIFSLLFYLSLVGTPSSGTENEIQIKVPLSAESKVLPLSAPYRPGQGPPQPRRHSMTNQMQTRVPMPSNMNRPRGPPPSSPYGIPSMTPPGRPGIGNNVIGTPTSSSAMTKSPKGLAPLSPTRLGAPPRGPPPRGIQIANHAMISGHPLSGRGANGASPHIREVIQTPTERNGPLSRNNRSNSTFQSTDQDRKDFPTDVSQLGPPPPDVQSFAPSFALAPMKPFGTLSVTISRGLSLKAGQGVFGRANPYVKITCGEKVMTTKPHIEGGKNPIWDANLFFQIMTEKEMIVEVFDKQPVGEDKLMGKSTVGILDWIALESFEGKIELLDKSGSVCGELSVKSEFTRTSEDTLKPKATADEEKTETNQEFSDQEILNAFRSFDLDKNNYVGAAEIRHVLISIGERATDEEVDEMIKMVDKDGDGQVSFDEFYRMVTGGKRPPHGLGRRGSSNISHEHNETTKGIISPQAVLEARNLRRKLLDEFARDNDLKPESIKRAHKRYVAIDKNNIGMIDYIEFCEILQVDPSPQCENVFAKYDYRKTGMIDAKEILIALANFTGAGKDDKLKFAFMLFDEDNDGVISKQELVKILKANHMAKTDSEVQRKAETIMAQADKNGDGVMSYDEFVAVSRKFPNILFPSYSNTK